MPVCKQNSDTCPVSTCPLSLLVTASTSALFRSSVLGLKHLMPIAVSARRLEKMWWVWRLVTTGSVGSRLGAIALKTSQGQDAYPSWMMTHCASWWKPCMGNHLGIEHRPWMLPSHSGEPLGWSRQSLQAGLLGTPRINPERLGPALRHLHSSPFLLSPF